MPSFGNSGYPVTDHCRDIVLTLPSNLGQLSVTVRLGRHSPWDHSAAQLFLPTILPPFFLGKIQKVLINVLVINLLRSTSQGTPSRTIWKHLVRLSIYLLTVAPPIIK